MIRMKCTGTPEHLAEKLEISRSGVYEYLNYMKSLGAPIEYCRFKSTFYYTSEVQLFMKFTSV